MLVLQLTRVSKVRSYSTRRTAVESVGSGSANSVRWLLARSVTESWLLQFQRPMRSGVANDRSLWRLLKKPVSVSGPAAPGTSSCAAGLWKVWLLLYENCGDQVMACPTLIGAGVSVTRGKFWVTRSLARFWERLPPRLKVPQAKRLSKFSDDVTCAVARFGSTVLRCTTCTLVK